MYQPHKQERAATHLREHLTRLAEKTIEQTAETMAIALNLSSTSWVVVLFVPQVMSSISVSLDILDKQMVELG